jgi:hypothetical protein
MVNLWKRLVFVLSGSISEEDATKLARAGKEVIDKTKLGFELKYLDVPEAEYAAKFAAATSELIRSLRHEQQAVLRIGSLLVVKTTADGSSKILVETVSTDVRRILDANPGLLNSPPDLYLAIQGLKDKQQAEGE